MIYQFFNDLFINVNVPYINIIRFIFVDMMTFLLSCVSIYILYILFYKLIINYVRGVKK